MDKKRKASIRRYVTLAILVILVALLAALPLLTKQETDENKASILTAEAVPGSISRNLLGGGPLEGEKAVEVRVPSGVKITKLLVSGGDNVAKGDPIAQIDKVSAMTAVTEIQDSMASIESDMKQLSWKITPGAITVNEEGKLLADGREIPTERIADYAEYFQLAEQHRKYEQLLAELFPIWQAGAIVAPADGMVADLDTTMVQKLAATDGDYPIMLLAAHVPNDDGSTSDDSTEYYGTVGKLQSIEGAIWNMYVNLIPQPVADFAAPDVSTAGLSANPIPYPASPVMIYTYDETGDTWSWTTGTAEEGDILLFVDSWVIKIGHEDLTETPGETGGIPGMGDLPTDMTPEQLKEMMDKLDQAQQMMSGLSGIGGGFGGFGGMGGFGQKQEETLYSTEGSLLCNLIPLDTMTLSIAIDEQDIAEVESGMTADITFDALSGEHFTGTVTKVSKFGTNNGGSSKFAVELEIPYADGMLPGMNAAVTISLETLDDVLTLPVAALNELNGQTVVYTGYDVKKEVLLNPVPVKTGLSDGTTVQILSGIEEGTAVWYSYYDKVEISTAVESRSPFGR